MIDKFTVFLKAPLTSLAVMSMVMPASAKNNGVQNKALAPASKFDLSHWKLTLPVDLNKDGKVDNISVKQIKKYSHPDFFYLDENENLIFTAPNKGAKTKNTSNTRSELRYMLRGKNTKIKTHISGNNFSIDANDNSDKFGSIGGKMQATLKVDHVALNSGIPNKRSAYSVVVGQIHAVKYKSTKSGFGYGNEPLKIFYKKWPGHKTGSVFWTYERNLAKNDANRRDIAYPVWGHLWDNPNDPSVSGIGLGEAFSYTVNVHKNTMYLTFESAGKPIVEHQINLTNNVDANGTVDLLDNRYSYGGDSLYFKAGAYNQCSVSTEPAFWAAGCGGTGDWAIDKANGDYVQVAFSKLEVGNSIAP